jgi:hypothetical protein
MLEMISLIGDIFMNKPSIILLLTCILMAAPLFSRNSSTMGNNVTTEGMVGATDRTRSQNACE